MMKIFNLFKGFYMKKYFVFMAIILILVGWFLFPTIKKALNYSFIHPNNGFYDIVYKGDILVSVNQKNCVLVVFEGNEFPSSSFKCEIQVSKDLEHIKLIIDDKVDIWENGNLFKDQ